MLIIKFVLKGKKLHTEKLKFHLFVEILLNVLSTLHENTIAHAISFLLCLSLDALFSKF
jgi:hypothetical protein